MRGGMTDEDVKAEVMGVLAAAALLPRLVVFDLDYTLWPFYCECRSKRESPRLYPEARDILNALKEKDVKMAIASRTPTPDIARVYLNKLGLTNFFTDMCVCTRGTGKLPPYPTSTRKEKVVVQVDEGAIVEDQGQREGGNNRYTKVLKIKVDKEEIFPSWTHKTEHLKNIQQKTSIPFSSMLFFDDEDRNIQSVSRMGVTSVLVDDGVNIKALREGLINHARSENQRSSNSS